MRLIFGFLIVGLSIAVVSTTLSASDKKKDKKKKNADESEAEAEKPEDANAPKVLTKSLLDVGLMDLEVDRKALIKYYQGWASEDKTKKFKKPTLGFVTPWNNYGYDFAKEFAKKFDMISPVWLQIRGDFKAKGCFFTGTHDVDKGWMAELKTRNPEMKIVPRVMFEAWEPQQYEMLFKSEQFMHRCISAIKSTCQMYGFDGVVMEVWLQAGNEYKDEILHFMADLKVAMNDENRLAILVLPPAIRELSAQRQIITRKDFAAIAPVVDYVTLMTYDYFHPGSRPGPTAPLPWVRGNIEVLAADGDPNRAKILTGLNFYGYDFVQGQYPQPKLARDLVDVLKKHSKSKVQWDSFGHENFIEYTDKKSGEKHTMYYPTIKSMADKIEIAELMGTGLMIWELGQGPRIFGELL